MVGFYDKLSRVIDFTALTSPVDRFVLDRVMGEGTYGEVHAALDKETSKSLTNLSV